MRCPSCIAKDRFVVVRSFLPVALLPLRVVIDCVRCDSCLNYFYRIRGAGWLIASHGPYCHE